jgi:hypothetical protein
MSRSLGVVEWSGGKRAYFVHDNTTGISIRELYDSADSARAANDQHCADQKVGRHERGGEVGQDVAVVRVALCQGWNIVEHEVDWALGLATSHWLLSSPVDRFSEPYGLLLIDDTIHLSTQVDGGFQGRYEAPICDGQVEWNRSWKEIPLADWFNRPLHVCGKCLQAH